jgi:glycosyltransferase involved in cell wall biosynthesis
MFAFPEVSMNGCFEEREEFYTRTISKAFAVFCESNAGKEELVQYSRINSDRVFVVPIFPGEVAGLKLGSTEVEAEIDKLGLKGKRFFFYPAQFWSHKNHYNLLAAFRILLQNDPGLQLVLSGSDKGNLSYIRQVVKEWGLETQVQLPGFLSIASVHSLYRRAVAMVMPSFLGPTNMPLLEAQAIGCPVICSNLKGHREMLGDNAFYIEPGDPLSIADAMEKVLRHPHGNTPAANAVFNIENTVRQVECSFLSLRSKRKAFGFNFDQY